MVARVDMKFGEGVLGLTLPEGAQTDVRPLLADPGLPAPAAAVARALEAPIGSRPLSEVARGRRNACVVISDITRPVPNDVVLPPILATLEAAGIARRDILILIATGLHRPNLGEELVHLVGAEIARDYRIENHVARDVDEQVTIATTPDGIPLQIDRRYVEADLKVLTGLIEPHLMAGFSGGRKAILPGLASVETMRYMHGFAMIQQDRSGYGYLDDNPFHHASLMVARKAGADFIVNVAINAEHEITAVFAGELDEAHRVGVGYVRERHFTPVDDVYDVVVTTGGGAPLDRTLYQSWKGVVGVLGAVHKGGSIVILAENSEGAGSADFRSCFDDLTDPRDFFRLYSDARRFKIDQWMAQEVCNAALRAEVYYYCRGIAPEELRRYFVSPVASPEEGLARALARAGGRPRVLVLPDGPYLIPFCREPVGELYDWFHAA
ncbi:nickel-dependent lactate racemase [bacterium]|nr:nickel-dependent lactate racemase [bacterium]